VAVRFGPANEFGMVGELHEQPADVAEANFCAWSARWQSS
jgi:hypothetical protein